ncbi:SWIM zinc finger family protein, partial [Streptomyces tanashiensis]
MSGYGQGRGHGNGHGDDERTFEALPPAPGGGFTRTWWGRAWLKALEDTALDGQQLKAGRRHARAGAVGAVSVRPGRITALVKDRDGTAYRGDVLVREFSEEEWDRLLDLAVDSAGHIAALLDREMPPHLVEDAAAAGLDLLPGIGDLDPECGCEAWDHCPHTAALCYQVARLLDEDPFVLLLMRGRGERTLLDQLPEGKVTKIRRSCRGGNHGTA